MICHRSILSCALRRTLQIGGACLALAATVPSHAASLAEIQSLSAPTATSIKNKLTDARAAVLREEAMRYAMGQAVASRYSEIVEALKSPAKTRELDRTFDRLFREAAMSADGRLLYPVVTRVDQAVTSRSPDHTSETAVTYRLAEPARLVVAPPSWRDYLLKEYPAGEAPNPVVLPQNDSERRIWQQYTSDAWTRGIEMADRLFDSNLASMQVALMGRITYRRLEQTGMVRMPKMAKADYGVVINGETLSIGQQEFTITAPSGWNETKQWKPIIGRGESR